MICTICWAVNVGGVPLRGGSPKPVRIGSLKCSSLILEASALLILSVRSSQRVRGGEFQKGSTRIRTTSRKALRLILTYYKFKDYRVRISLVAFVLAHWQA